MEIQISQEIENKFKSASKTLGFIESEVLERAILFYLAALQNEIEMKKEFQELDLLSDEALINFEQNL